MQQKLERYFQLCGNMLLPCFLFVLGLFTYLWSSSLNYDTAVVFHYLFLGEILTLLLIFINFNQGQVTFFTLTVFLSYIAINCLKKTYYLDMTETAWYHNIVFLLPLNLLFFYLFPPRRFIEKKSIIYLAVIAIEYMAVEYLSQLGRGIFLSFYGFNIVSGSAFAVLFFVTLCKAVSFGKLYDYSWFFAVISLFFGVHYATDPAGLSIFFLTAGAIILSMVIYNLVYHHYYDELTGLRNRLSYLRDSRRFPPKYSLGVISVDGYDGLRKGLTSRQTNELLILLANICQEQFSDSAVIYRYYENQFLIVCETMNLKEIRSEFENIRRQVAASEFVLYNHATAIKITISGGVAEKKRTDANASEVLERAHKVMNETLKFSGNVISPVPRSERR